MTSRLLAVAGAAALLTPFVSLEAQAFGRGEGCGLTAQAVACYKQVNTPDLYTTRYRSVMVKPGWWETKTIPAVYGTRQKQVMVQPGQTVWHTQPAQWGVVHEQRVVRPGYESWMRKTVHHGDRLGGLFGHRRGCGEQVQDVMCKVQVPPQVETVERKVMVAPEKRVAQHVPARYEWVDQPYMIQPARTVRVFHPPVYESVAERVLVQRGTTTWQPVGGGAMPIAHPVPAPAPVVDEEPMPAPRNRDYMPIK